MSRFCTSCGAEVLEEAGFCANCGKPVTQEASRKGQQAQHSAPLGSVATANLQGALNLPAGPARNNNKYIRWALGAAAVLVMCVLGLAGIAFVGSSLGLALIGGAAIAILPVPLYLALALWIERYEREPVWMLAGAFLWGGTVAIFFSGIINTIGGSVVTWAFGSEIGSFFGSVISAPIVEESTKALALFILFFWKRDEFDGVIDGIVYAAMVGLGFAMVENFIYYGRALVEGGVAGGAQLFVMRGVFGPFGHPIYTAMTGIGLGLASRSSNTLVKYAAPLAGLTLAITLHAIWNGAGYVLGGLAGLIFLFFFYMPFLIISILAIVFFALRQEGRIIGKYLTPELHSGLLTQPEYDSLTSVRGRLGGSFSALTNGGFGTWRAHARFNQAASELAFHRDRVARGITSVDAQSREAAYVRLLQDSKVG